jgi:drug/metabolite transporter (DMT)-like permease
MTLWILLAIVSYVMLALSGIADKFLLSHVNRHPVVFAFYTGITGPLSLLLAPFGLQILLPIDFYIAIIGGVCFVLALYFLYSAIQQTTVSRILPIQGGMVPTFTLVLAYFLLNERLTMFQDLAFIFLVVGAVLMSIKHDDTGWHPQALKNALIAALLFSLSFVFTKYIFDRSNFISGMVWTRFGFTITALGFLVSKSFRNYIFHAPEQAKAKNIALYYGARVNGTIAGFLQNYAISLGSVSIVNALQGVQFTFLLIITIILSIYFPKILKEKITKAILLQKIIAMILITIGLLLLTQ